MGARGVVGGGARARDAPVGLRVEGPGVGAIGRAAPGAQVEREARERTEGFTELVPLRCGDPADPDETLVGNRGAAEGDRLGGRPGGGKGEGGEAEHGGEGGDGAAHGAC